MVESCPGRHKKARTRGACFARAARLWLFRLCRGMRQEGEDLGTLWKLGKNGRPRRRRRVQVRSYGGSQIFEDAPRLRWPAARKLARLGWVEIADLRSLPGIRTGRLAPNEWHLGWPQWSRKDAFRFSRNSLIIEAQNFP